MVRYLCLVVVTWLLLAAPVWAQGDFPLDGVVTAPTPNLSLPVNITDRPVVDPTVATKETIELRAQFAEQVRQADERTADERTLRLDQLRDLEMKLSAQEHVAIREIIAIRTEALEKQATIETTRVNDVLQVTANALKDATLATNETAKGLALQTETLRSTLADQLATATDALSQRISAMESIVRVNEGRQGVADPAVAGQLAEQARLLRELSEARAATAGQGEGRDDLWGFIVGAIGFGMALMVFWQSQSKRHDERETRVVYATPVVTAPGGTSP